MMMAFQIGIIVPFVWVIIFMSTLLVHPITSFSQTTQQRQTFIHGITDGRLGKNVKPLAFKVTSLLERGNAFAAAPEPSLLLLTRKASAGSLLVLYQAAANEGGANDDDDTEKEITTTTTTTSTSTKQSLKEKMSKWQASEEEIKAASLGGVVNPRRESENSKRRSDSFDVGLYVAFPFMIIACLLFLAFPFLVDKIDVSSVGPPPTS